jgi:hypothetical protein
VKVRVNRRTRVIKCSLGKDGSRYRGRSQVMGRSGTGNQVPRDHSSGRRRANKQACHDGEQATPLEPCSRCCNWQHRGPRYYAARHDSAQDLLWIPEQALSRR